MSLLTSFPEAFKYSEQDLSNACTCSRMVDYLLKVEIAIIAVIALLRVRR